MGFQRSHYPHKKQRHGLSQAVFLLAILLSACLETNPAPSPQPATVSPNETQAFPTSQSTPFQSEDTPAPATTTPAPTQTIQARSSIDIDPSALQDQTIQFWYAGSSEAGRVWENLAKEFTTSNEWGIEVQASEAGSYDELDSRLEAALQSGAPPDLVAALTYQAAAWDAGLKRTNSAELVIDLNDYVIDPDWGLNSDEQADFYPAFWDADVLEDKRLGLPAIRSAQVLFYNQAWAEELGFPEPPATPGQFQEQACAAAQANKADDDQQNDSTGGWIISTQPAAVAGWLESYGGDYARLDRSDYQFDTPQVEAAFSFLRGLYDAGCAWLIPENASPENDFANRRGLFATGSLADIPNQIQAMERAGNRDRWTVLPFPSSQGEPAISAYGPSYVILKNTPERQLAAWLFARWLSQQERQAPLALASGSLPTRRSAAQQLSAQSASTAQWHAALNLIDDARPEPPFASWTTVRWALGDAATQLFRYYFTADGIPSLIQLLDETAQELHDRQ